METSSGRAMNPAHPVVWMKTKAHFADWEQGSMYFFFWAFVGRRNPRPIYLGFIHLVLSLFLCLHRREAYRGVHQLRTCVRVCWGQDLLYPWVLLRTSWGHQFYSHTFKQALCRIMEGPEVIFQVWVCMLSFHLDAVLDLQQYHPVYLT